MVNEHVGLCGVMSNKGYESEMHTYKSDIGPGVLLDLCETIHNTG